ncbi:MAG: LysR family transcriptional regulator [Firmicutes bacterium]|nr:LysR family transcriptional regulator [Bacillota bacterium]MDD3850855.1 LysR family transcriptional regulator [Bacillota bacterium]MDD4707487.1 LysR family transcriptional regulator [Bacillota bacterium]
MEEGVKSLNTQSLYYFLEVAKELNITSVSRRLFISQQSLSNRIKQLERYFGVKLFHRKPSLKLTYAGEQLVTAASKIINIEENIKLQFNDILDNKFGCIRVGSAPIRALSCIPEILPVFNEKYPNVKVILTEFGSLEEEKRLLKGEIDLHIGINNENNPNNINKKLLKNKMYFIVPIQLLNKYIKGDVETFIKHSKHGASVRDFEKFPFMLRPEPNLLTEIIKNYMEEIGVIPNIYFESNTHEILLSLCRKGLGIIVVTQIFLHYMIKNGYLSENSDICAFPILHNGQIVYTEVSVSYLKCRYLPKYTKDFLRITENVFNNIAQTYPQ